MYTLITESLVTTPTQLISSIIGLLALVASAASILGYLEGFASQKKIGRWLHKHFDHYPYDVLQLNEQVAEEQEEAAKAKLVSSRRGKIEMPVGVSLRIQPHDDDEEVTKTVVMSNTSTANASTNAI